MMFDTISALVGELAVSAFDPKIRWSCKRLRIAGYGEDCYRRCGEQYCPRAILLFLLIMSTYLLE